MAKSILTQELLKSLLSYDPDTGVFIWKASRSGIRKNRVAGFLHLEEYLLIEINGKEYKAGRLAWLYIHGIWPDQIDHINHIRSDNKITNLRNVSQNENLKNKGLHLNNTTGFNGVSWDKNRNKWQANITVNKKRIYLGRFENKEDAISIRSAANIKYGFHPNHGLQLTS